MKNKGIIGIIAALLTISFLTPAFAETIILKSGQKIEGKIIERNDEYIKIDFQGVVLPYFYEDIGSIDGVTPNQAREKTPLPQTTAVDVSSSGIDTTHIHKILKHLDYPENTWPDIERELIAFLSKINFPQLKQEAAQVKSNPEQLKQFVAKLGRLIEQEGCRNNQSPHPLIKLLITSLGTEDIFQVIEASPISLQQKEKLRRDLVSCSAVSQLGSILLESLDINTKAVITPDHVFNCVPLDNRRILFVDFSNQFFEIIDLNQYYKLEGKYQVLKEEYRINPERKREITEQWEKGVQLDILKEVLNLLYFNIYITDDYAVTPGIYYNCGYAYSNQGNFAQAIVDFTKAVEINSYDTESYYNRGIAYVNQGNFAQAISDFTRAIEINPKHAKAYSNRGFIYDKQDNFAQAIPDFTKAIEINPNDAIPYYNRGFVYYETEEYDKAWADVHKAEELGYPINPEFLTKLKEASGKEN